MCGIYFSNYLFSESKIKQKLDKIASRGPDFQGIYIKDSNCFGHNRLAIIDLDERSNQPMQFDQFIIVFNGEIYNYLDIKKELLAKGVYFNTTSDTEVLLKGYVFWGEKVLDKINGMFAFAIYDEIKNIVFIARDRLGVKPLYYSWKNGFLELCSQLSPLETSGEVDSLAIEIYLKTGYIPSPNSIYLDIKKLKPGSFGYFDLDKKTKTIKTFWDLDKITPTRINYQKAKAELKELLYNSVKIRLQSDVQIGCFLSGGIDSALISSMASKISKKKIKTFTVGFENKRFDESEIAKQFSNILNTSHKTIVCKENDILSLLEDFFITYDEPFADSSALPSLLLNKVTKPYATVVLSGDGGDESFFGYNHFIWIKKVKWLFKIPFFVRRFISFFFPFSWIRKRGPSLKNIFRMKKIEEFISGIFYGFDSILIDNGIIEKGYSKYLKYANSSFQKTADLNIKLWLENDSNVKVDRASMAYSVEVRSPFLDYRVIEFARKLPISYRFKNGKGKRIIRDILKDFIPEKLFDKPKKGFSIPLGDWMRNELKNEILFYLNEDKISKIPKLDVPKIIKILKLHMAIKADYSMYLWRVYVLSKWIHLNQTLKKK